MFLGDREMRALRIISNRLAHQLVGQPLETLALLIDNGLAHVSRRYYDTRVSGKTWHCEEVVITDAGRAILTK